MIIFKMNLRDIDYDSIAERFMPGLFKNITVDSKLSMRIANELLVKNKITNSIAKGVLKIFPQAAKEKIVVDLFSENKIKIIASLNKYLEDNQTDIRIADLRMKGINQEVSNMLKVEVTLEEINYDSLVKSILPKIYMVMSEKNEKQNSLVKVLMDMEEVPSQMLSAAIAVLSPEATDQLIVKLFSIYKEDIIDMINQKVKEQHISVDVSDIDVNSKK